jgi:hypothetical protein
MTAPCKLQLISNVIGNACPVLQKLAKLVPTRNELQKKFSLQVTDCHLSPQLMIGDRIAYRYTKSSIICRIAMVGAIDCSCVWLKINLFHVHGALIKPSRGSYFGKTKKH